MVAKLSFGSQLNCYYANMKLCPLLCITILINHIGGWLLLLCLFLFNTGENPVVLIPLYTHGQTIKSDNKNLNMNTYFFVAACLAFVLGLAHSVLGEVLIFRRMRRRSFIPTEGGPILREHHVRILWATWHLVTVFGWGFGAILLRLSFPASPDAIQATVENSILVSMLAASLIVLVGTKGKHPGWVVLLGIAILLWLG